MGVSVFEGLYLVLLGTRLIRRAWRAGDGETGPLANPARSAIEAPAVDSGNTFEDYRLTAMLALVTALSNAQAILFITSIFAAAGALDANAATGVAAIVIMLSCNSVYLAALGWLLQREKMRAGYARYRAPLEGVMGALFLFFGGLLLWRSL